MATWVCVPSTARDAAVEIAAHQLLVAGGLGVKVDEDHFDLGAAISASTRSAAWNGQSTGRMNTRPSRLNTATCTPLRARAPCKSVPGASGG